MIGRINGILIEKTPPQVVIECAGVGYECEVPMSTFYNLPSIGENIVLFTQFIVREDAQLLYGFGSEAERATFRQLLKVNGVGAKSALSILSGLSLEDLSTAIGMQDATLLMRVPGVGKKTAERLLLELKDKFISDRTVSSQSLSAGSARSDILNALISLGYNEKESVLTLKKLPEDINVSDGIKLSLKLLSKSS